MLEVCDICSAQLETRTASAERPYHYTESGLDCAYLVGVEVWRCSKCDVESGAIPDIDGLHRLVAEALLDQHVPLTPREFMYLRKEALIGLPELSRRTGVEREVFQAFESAEVPTLRTPFTCDFDGPSRTWGFKRVPTAA
jgi:hypothetical protein